MSTFIPRVPLKWFVIAFAVAALAGPLSFVLWRAPAGVAGPPASMLPLLIPVAVVIPALAFGVGIAFMLLGRSLLVADAPALSRAALVSITWLFTNWWPHSNFHRVASGWGSIVAIDYVFHTTVIVATIIVAAFFISAVRRRG